MKTKHQTKTIKSLLLAFVLFISMGLNKAMACTANFTYTTGANGLVNFTSTSVGVNGNTMYYWNTDDGNGLVSTGFTNTYSHYFLANGTYNVLLFIQDSLGGGCSDSIRIAVTVSNVVQPCNLSASATANLGGGGQVKFTSTSQNTNSNTLYFWNFGDGSPRVQGKDTITHKYTYNGFYQAWIVTQDTGGAYCIDSNYVYVNVTNADSNNCSQTHPSFTYSTGLNGYVSFTSTSIVHDNPQYIWNPGDGSGSVNLGYYGTSYNHFYQTNGTFNAYLKLVGDSSYSCIDSIVMPVTVSNVSGNPCNMVTSFTATRDSNGTQTFISTTTDTIYGNTQYFWDPGDGSGVVSGTSKFTHTYPFIGYYYPTLKTMNTGGAYCMDSTMDSINVWNRDSLQARFIYVSDSANNGQYDFTSTSLGTNNNTYYRWLPGDGDPADSGIGMTTYTHIYQHNGPYNAVLTIWYTIPPRALGNRSESIHFAESSYTLTVNVNTVVTGVTSVESTTPKLELYPNPNNGQFNLSLSNLPKNQKAEVSITNLLGETMYTAPIETTGNNFIQNINLQGTPAGMYFVRIVAGNQVFTSRMVINK